ncbi:MAG: MFS transporter, partial [Bifidobacterium sp.]|nr:MFS transporter [Bifidobacterium sp.]
MVNENNDRREDPAEGIGARVGDDIKVMASADETQGAGVGQSVDASFAPDTGRRLNTTEKFSFAIGFVLVY